MGYNNLRFGKWLLVVALFVLGVQFALAGNAPLVSGSYKVVRNTSRGSFAQVRMRIHLVNHGPSDLSIRRITLWDFSHPASGGSKPCTLILHANGSADAVEEFTIGRADYHRWQRGARPRFVLEVDNPVGAERRAPKATTVVRLEPISAQEAK